MSDESNPVSPEQLAEFNARLDAAAGDEALQAELIESELGQRMMRDFAVALGEGGALAQMLEREEKTELVGEGEAAVTFRIYGVKDVEPLRISIEASFHRLHHALVSHAGLALDVGYHFVIEDEGEVALTLSDRTDAGEIDYDARTNALKTVIAEGVVELKYLSEGNPDVVLTLSRV